MNIPNNIAVERLEKPFEVRPWETEWDNINPKWANPVPFINARFGARPLLTSTSSLLWYIWNKDVLNDTVESNPVIYLGPGSLDSHIEQLYQACVRTGKPRLIVTFEKIRSVVPVPDNVRVIHTHSMAYQYSKMFSESGVAPVFHRKVDDMEHSFMIMAGNPIGPGPHLLMMLKELGALDNALYGRPEIKANDRTYPDDALGINRVIKDLNQGHLGGEYVRFDHKRNLSILNKCLNKCHFFVAMDRDVFYDHYVHWGIAEKHLQCFTSTAPVLPIWADAEAQQMKEWGFRFKNNMNRRPNESLQDVVKRYCREILFYSQMTKNKDWAQSWQDLQGEDTFHNFQLAKNLHNDISSEIVRQIDELPTEFQNLK
jgi:hypothetical protein